MKHPIVTQGAAEWLAVLKSRYKLEYTRMVDNEEAISIFLSEKITPNNTIMVARFCKASKVGVVMDRRLENKPTEIKRRSSDNTQNR